MSNNLDKFAEEAFKDIYDEDIAAIGKVYREVSEKWRLKSNTMANLREMATEMEGKMVHAGFRARVDWTPCLYGGDAILDILGPIEERKEETDHDKKAWEVNKSIDRGEKWLGQKGKIV